MQEGYVLGLDGGGTKTVCLAADAAGQVLGKGVAGPSNYLKEGLYTTKQSLSEAIREALRSAGLQSGEIRVVCAGLAGVARREDRRIITRVFEEMIPSARLLLEIDAFVALAGATGGEPGVIVISGTGSIAFGVNAQGQRARSGGWGHVVGDEGSGYDIARQGLAAALRDYDGRGPGTTIRQKITREFYLQEFDELIPIIYSGHMGPSRIAALFPIVLQAAEENDAVARELIQRAAAELCALVVSVLEQLGMRGSRIPLALAGGVFRALALCREFEEKIGNQAPGTELITPRSAPEEGAILVARAALQGNDLFTDQQVGKRRATK